MEKLCIAFVLMTSNDHFVIRVESGDGSTQSETGSLKNLGHPEGPTAVKAGSYSFTSPDGQKFTGKNYSTLILCKLFMYHFDYFMQVLARVI